MLHQKKYQRRSEYQTAPFIKRGVPRCLKHHATKRFKKEPFGVRTLHYKKRRKQNICIILHPREWRNSSCFHSLRMQNGFRGELWHKARIKRKSTGQRRDRQDASITSMWGKTQNHRKLDKNNKDSETTGYSGGGKVTFIERLGGGGEIWHGTKGKAAEGFPGQHPVHLCRETHRKDGSQKKRHGNLLSPSLYFSVDRLKTPAVSGSPFFFSSRSVNPGN